MFSYFFRISGLEGFLYAVPPQGDLKTRYESNLVCPTKVLSDRCVSLKRSPIKPLMFLKYATRNSTEQTSMRTKWFQHIAL